MGSIITVYEVVAVSGVGLPWGGQSNRQVSRPVVVASPQLAAALPVFLNPRQLVQADPCLRIHHVVFEAVLDDQIMLAGLVTKTVPGVLAYACSASIRARATCA